MCRPRSTPRSPRPAAPRASARSGPGSAPDHDLWSDARALAGRAVRDAGPRRLAAFGLIGLAALSILPGWILVPALATAGFALLGWHPFAWMSCGRDRGGAPEDVPAETTTAATPERPAAASDADGRAGTFSAATPVLVIPAPADPAPDPGARADAA